MDWDWGGVGWGGSYTESPELVKELVKQVATHIGPFARPGMIVGTPGLPKTRSGDFLFYCVEMLITNVVLIGAEFCRLDRSFCS